MDTIRMSSSDLFYWLISIDGRETELTSSEIHVYGSPSACDLPHTIKVNFYIEDFFSLSSRMLPLLP